MIMSATQTTSVSAHLSSSIFISPFITGCENPSAAQSTHTKVQNLIAGLAAKSIIVIEWGSLLYRRLNVPLVHMEFCFLVDDELMEAACQFTEEQGFPPSESVSDLIKCHGKYETIARHFTCSLQRLNFFPGSFIGFRANELYLVSLDLSKICLTPVFVLTAKPAPVVASLVRLISQLRRNDPMRSTLVHDLCVVISHSLFDMSYEGDYATLEEESDEELEQQRRQAVQQYQTWEGWRDEEIWITDAIQHIIQGHGHYKNLPAIS